MAYTAGSLHLRAGAPGDLMYKYDAGDDTMATVVASGYFNNTDDNLALVVDDLIFADCTDGTMLLKVSAVSSGTVTTQRIDGNLPIQTWATGTGAAADQALSVGFYEIGTSIATATAGWLPVPYPGAEVVFRKIGSGTQLMEIDAGSGATAITFDGTNRRITLGYEGDGFHLVGSSTTRWRIMNLNFTRATLQHASEIVTGT